MKATVLGQHSGPLRIAAFSDYRAQDMRLLIDAFSKIQPPPDLILYGGDDVERFNDGTNENFFELLASRARYGLCAIVGNDELPATRKLISGKQVFNLHKAPAQVGDYLILGSEGAPSRSDLPGIGYILYSEREIGKHLDTQRKAAKAKRLIVVSHAPPAGILDQAKRFSVDGQPRSIGSRALRRFIQKRKDVALTVCGHVHRCGGQHLKFRRTLVVNTANHDDDKAIARIAIVELGLTKEPRVEWQRIRPVSMVPGIGPASTERLDGLGIRTVDELALAQPALLRGVLPCGRPPELLIARARAIVEDRPSVLQSLKSTETTPIYLDIETDLDQTYIWLIGLCVGEEGEYRGFFADSPADERRILELFLGHAERYPGSSVLTCSGSRFEERMIRKRLSSLGFPTLVCERMTDLHQTISTAVALPTPSCRVKEIGAFFGYRYKHPDLDGFRVASLYQHCFQKLRNSARRRALQKKLCEYNEDDVRCLPFILRSIRGLCAVESVEPIRTENLFTSGDNSDSERSEREVIVSTSERYPS
jgi:Icc-related predicted phosphoesterase/uncharacterized protein YprB with RNaseH-like and TPR domain